MADGQDSQVRQLTGSSSNLPIGEPSPAHRISDTASGQRSAQNSIARVRWGTQALSTPADFSNPTPSTSPGRLACRATTTRPPANRVSGGQLWLHRGLP